MIPFVDLEAQRRRLGPELDAAIARVLEHGAFINGPEVKELEGALAQFSGAQHVVACANGTDALVLALRALGVGPGHAVVVPTFTFAATAEAVALVGARPVFADVRPDSFDLDPESLAAGVDVARAAGLEPVAAIPVDLFGQPAPYDELESVAAAHGLTLIADAAQSFGATLDSRRVGTLAPVTTTSFFPAKPLGCFGDGGAVMCQDEATADVMRSLRSHGAGAHKYDHERLGTNSRLDTLQAAVLLQKLTVFADELDRRSAVASRYTEGLAGEPTITTPVLRPGVTSAWAQYTIKVPHRDAVAARLHDAGVPTAVYYPKPLHHQRAFAPALLAPSTLPVAERLAGEVLSLPMHPYLEPEVQTNIIDAVLRAVSAGETRPPVPSGLTST